MFVFTIPKRSKTQTVQVHAQGCSHTNMGEKFMERVESLEAAEFCGMKPVDYALAILDGRMDDGEAAGYHWKAKIMPCAKVA